jgi:hypothetical protein
LVGAGLSRTGQLGHIFGPLPRLHGGIMFRALTTALAAVVLTFSAVSSAPGQTTALRFDGRPAFKEGKALGYFIWRDGDTWKLRWTTFGAEHRFTGRVVVEGGQIASFGTENFKPNENPVRARLKP